MLNLRIIQTARTEEQINQAAREGYFPLIKKVVPSDEIKSKFAVFQDPVSGEIRVVNDFRAAVSENRVIDFTYYYPYSFPSPFAAYLIPKDLKVGEEVILEDLIEDFVGMRWNQGDTYRLSSARAKWTGEDFVIFHDERMIAEIVG